MTPKPDKYHRTEQKRKTNVKCSLWHEERNLREASLGLGPIKGWAQAAKLTASNRALLVLSYGMAMRHVLKLVQYVSYNIKTEDDSNDDVVRTGLHYGSET